MQKPDQRLITILAIDDDRSVLESVVEAIPQDHCEIIMAGDAEAGLHLFRAKRPHIVITDLLMPNLNGMELLEGILSIDPGAEVILMSDEYSLDLAMESIRMGASDFVTKPLDVERLRRKVKQLIVNADTRRRALQLDQELLGNYVVEGMIGRSPVILELVAKIRRVAPHFRSVLLSGPTGTGKEIAARALHRLSPGASKPFGACNCSAIVGTLFESELFGYVRGAFTGATQDKVGLFEFANGGTVFLDEIGELPLEAQAKLLRVLENHEVQRVGSPVPRKVDLRVVAATNRDLRRMVDEQLFREDLYYRLAMVEIALPPLSQRLEDLPLLQRHFTDMFAKECGKVISGITRRAQALLARHPWPGNVRELENVIGSACILAQGPAIDIGDLPEYIRSGTTPDLDDKALTLEAVQQKHVLRILDSVQGNKYKAAEILGVSRTTLYGILNKIAAKRTA
jgi:DNA-binding NtrC family response regulator